jgi:hypothetical protein
MNFLDLLRAGHTDYVLNDAAFDYMRDRNLPAALIARLANEPATTFANQADWLAHLGRLEFAAADVTPEPADRLAGHRFASRPDPILIATEGALWGSIQTHDFLSRAVVLSDRACPCEGATAYSHVMSQAEHRLAGAVKIRGASFIFSSGRPGSAIQAYIL